MLFSLSAVFFTLLKVTIDLEDEPNMLNDYIYIHLSAKMSKTTKLGATLHKFWADLSYIISNNDQEHVHSWWNDKNSGFQWQNTAYALNKMTPSVHKWLRNFTKASFIPLT